MDNGPGPTEMVTALNDLKQIGMRLANNEQVLKAHSELWEVAVKTSDGVRETELRQQLHNLLDQSLDLRTEALHLVNKFLTS